MKAKTNVKALALLALGAAAVLLFTTEKGKKVRKAAKSKAEDLGDDFGDWREGAGDKLASLKKRFMKEVEHLTDELHDRFADAKEAGEERGKKLYKQTKEQLS